MYNEIMMTYVSAQNTKYKSFLVTEPVKKLLSAVCLQVDPTLR